MAPWVVEGFGEGRWRVEDGDAFPGAEGGHR